MEVARSLRINRERALQSCNRVTGLHRPHSAWRADSPRPAERPPRLPAGLAVLRRAGGHEPVLFSRDDGGWLGRRPGGVRADRRGSSAARHQAVGLELVGSLPAHSAALLSGERRRLTTACVCSRGLAPPRAAPRLHGAWPRRLACAHASATLLFPCRRLVGSAASRSPRTVRSSRRLLCSVEEGAPQRRTRSSEGVRVSGVPCGSVGLGNVLHALLSPESVFIGLGHV